MIFEIMGCSQEAMIRYGLDVEDVLLLDWFSKYRDTKKMVALVNPEDGKTYNWVNFQKLSEEYPTVSDSPRIIARRFTKLVEKGVLISFISMGSSGKRSCFRLGPNYLEIRGSLDARAKSLKSDMGEGAMSPESDMPSHSEVTCPLETNSLPSNNKPIKSVTKESVCSEVPQDGAPSQSPAILQIPLNDKTTYGVTEAQVKTWAELYPAVDVMQQLRQMIGWCQGNPRRCKTRNGVLRFVNSWLSREQDRGGKVSTGGPSMTRTMVSNDAFDGQQGGEVIW